MTVSLASSSDCIVPLCCALGILGAVPVGEEMLGVYCEP